MKHTAKRSTEELCEIINKNCRDLAMYRKCCQGINPEAVPDMLKALELFADLHIADLGTRAGNKARDEFMAECPEYVRFCKTARAAIAKAKEGQS